MKRIFPLVLLALCHVSYSQNGPAVVTEYEIKAAFLYNFAKFVDWPSTLPEQDSTTFRIGILGKDPFGSILDKIAADNKIQDKRLVVQRFQSPDDLIFSHILYISKSESQHMPAILRKLAGSSTLTVGESKNFIERGGVIRLLNKGNKVRFEISPAAAHQANLRISSRLLKLAENLKDTITNGHDTQ